MTAPLHFTPEQVREYHRIKAQKYRETHREHLREYDKKRYPQRQEVRRVKRFEGRFCKGCDIRLSSHYGAVDTVRYCVSCSKIRHRLYMQKYRAKIKRRKLRALAKASRG